MPNELLFQTILSPLLSSLVGALAVYVFAVRKNSVEKRSSYIEKQLSELYSPLAGYHKRIVAKFHVQSRLSEAADETWKALCQRYHDAGQPMEDHEEQFKPYGALIDYNNQQFREELFPLYKKMLDLFTEKYWLTDSETREFYQDYLEYVEIWERFLGKTVPHDVLLKIQHGGPRLEEFYRHVDHKLNQLQNELKDERFWNFRISGWSQRREKTV